MNGHNIFLQIFCFVLLATRGLARSILMSAILGEGSHFLCAAAVGEQLVEKGHNVTFLVSNAYAHRTSDAKFSELFNFEVFRHPIPAEQVHEQFDAFNARAFMPASSQMWTLTEVMRDGRAADCEALLQDFELMDRLSRANFSMIIYDIGWLCPILLAEQLGVPYIALSAVSTPCTITGGAGSVSSPAYVPELFSGFSNHMDFKERVLNSLGAIFIHLFGTYFRMPYDRIREKYHISSIDLGTLFAKSELFLVNSDFSVEFPCPLPPSVIPVGGLTTRPSASLSEDLETFMQSAGENGVVVCSMGTYFTSVPVHIIKNFLNAFARLPQKVVFQLRKVPPEVTLPANVMTLPWLPQNDLLGHEKTRAFMYQGGNNGFYEALYHAVPIVVVPIHGDQYDTGAKVASHGLGISIDKLTLTESRIYDALKEVTTNASYSRTTERLSAMFRDRPMTPSEKAAFWIDHVMTHGGHQYQSPYVDLNFIERNLIDVSLFLSGCMVLIVIMIVMVSRLFIQVWTFLFCSPIHKDKRE